MPENIRILNFKTNVLLKNIIGKDLINNDNIAVLELVKNSFDAQAKKVDITFEGIQRENPSEGRLIIADDGTGMSLEDIETKWLNIAYSEKKEAHTQNGRMMAGAKGVGRFSCDRLGENLKLYTRKQGQGILLLEVNWGDFEVENEHELEIQHIDMECKTITDEEFYSTFNYNMHQGTLLEITNLRSSWTQWQPRKNEWNTDQLISLRRYLEKLASPSAAFNKDDFQLELNAGEFAEKDELTSEHNRVNGRIENKIFEKLPYTTTIIQAEITSDNKIITTLTDKNRQIVKITERNHLTGLSGLKISIYYLNPYAKAYFKKQTGIRSIDYGSIFLFVNGFRVSGLGDYGDDWLRMEVRKTQGYARFLGSREVVGRVEITDPNHNIKIVSSREGIVADKLTQQIIDVGPRKFQGFYYKTLKRLERYVVQGLDWDKTTETTEEIEGKILKSENWGYNPLAEKYEKSQSEKDKNLLSVIQPIVEQDTRPENIIDVDINLKLLADVKDEADQKTKDKFSRFIAKHHIDIPQLEEVQQIKKETNALKEKLKKAEIHISDTRKEKEEALKTARKEKQSRQQAEIQLKSTKSEVENLKKSTYFQQAQIDHLDTFAKKDITNLIGYLHHIGIYSNTIETNIQNIGALIQEECISDELREIITDIDFDAKKISVLSKLGQRAIDELDETQTFDLTEYVSQYIKAVVSGKSSDLANISTTNTSSDNFRIKANPTDISVLIDNLINNSSKANANAAMISFERNDTHNIMRYTDNGIGLDSGITHANQIFKLGFTTTHGSGIGLHHVQRIVRESNGNIEVNTSIESGFELIFTWRIT